MIHINSLLQIDPEATKAAQVRKANKEKSKGNDSRLKKKQKTATPTSSSTDLPPTPVHRYIMYRNTHDLSVVFHSASSIPSNINHLALQQGNMFLAAAASRGAVVSV